MSDERSAPRILRLRDIEYSHPVDMWVATVETAAVFVAALVAAIVYTKASLIGFIVALGVIYALGLAVKTLVSRDGDFVTSPEQVDRYSRRRRRAELWGFCIVAAIIIALHTT